MTFLFAEPIFSHMSISLHVMFYKAMFRAWLKWVVREGASLVSKLCFSHPPTLGYVIPTGTYRRECALFHWLPQKTVNIVARGPEP